MIDLSRSRRKPFDHQLIGAEWLSKRTDPASGRLYPGALLGDEMRLGKTQQVINAVQYLYEQNEIDAAIVVAPAPVRDVWYDPELGEIAKHRWEGLPTLITEYHSTVHKWTADTEEGKRYLTWIITNYELIRYGLKSGGSKGWTGPYVEPLLKICGPRTVLVQDESSAIANYSSLQTRACRTLRKKCGFVVMLNGTPFVEDPESLFSQAYMIDKRILGLENIGQYRARYGIMGGHVVEIVKFGRKIRMPVEIVGWRHQQRPDCCDVPDYISSPVHGPGPGLEEIQAKLAPYILRRLRKDCFDMPPKLDPVSMTVTMKPETWRVYKEMRDSMVTWLEKNRVVATAAQAGNKVMRLAQITSGFLGGLRDEEAECPECAGGGVALGSGPPGQRSFPLGVNLEQGGHLGDCPTCGGTGRLSLAVPPKDVGREKLDFLLGWVKKRLREDKDMRMIVWCRFQFELHRMIKEVSKAFPQIKIRSIYGGQSAEDRLEGFRLMHPEYKYDGPGLLGGTLGTGSQGLNMAGGRDVLYMSNAPSLMLRQQSEDRTQGPDQKYSVSYTDVVAVGPKGEKTVDHITIKGLRTKQNLAAWTCSAWIKAFKGEI